MGYFNINSILYNFRKIFKYLSISLAFISFIILALLLMSKSVNAESLPDYPPFPSFADDYEYHIVVYRADLNRYSLFLAHTRPYIDMNMTSSGYTGALVFPGWVNRQNFFTTSDSTWVDAGTFQGYYFYGVENSDASVIPSFVYSNFDIYDTSGNLFYPATPSYREPFIALPNDSTQAYISGEFSQFMVIGTAGIEDLQFFLTANPDVLPTTNSLALNLDDDSPYYLNNFEPVDGSKYYLIPKYDLPQGYTNDTPYHAWLAYRYNNQVYLTDVISWTTNFTAKAIENDRIRLDSGMADSLSDVRSFLFNKKVNYGDYNLPNITFDFDQEHFLSDLFENIRQAFIGNTYTDFEFTFPFSNETITIPSNYVELHCPSIIVNLIRLFYWYIIGRYILKDVFRTIDKMRQGDWFLRSDGNIKTEVL